MGDVRDGGGRSYDHGGLGLGSLVALRTLQILTVGVAIPYWRLARKAMKQIPERLKVGCAASKVLGFTCQRLQDITRGFTMALVKYPNRRIYDTEAHQYFPAVDLRGRLLKGETVRCKQSLADVTGEVLVALIVKDVRDRCGPEAEALRRLMQGYMAKWPKG